MSVQCTAHRSCTHSGRMQPCMREQLCMQGLGVYACFLIECCCLIYIQGGCLEHCPASPAEVCHTVCCCLSCSVALNFVIIQYNASSGLQPPPALANEPIVRSWGVCDCTQWLQEANSSLTLGGSTHCVRCRLCLGSSNDIKCQLTATSHVMERRSWTYTDLPFFMACTTHGSWVNLLFLVCILCTKH
jgi:hypothetical protein